MHIEDKLQSREWLAGALDALDFGDDAPDILAAVNQQELLRPANIAALELCVEKWRTGQRLAANDLSGITVDRFLFLKAMCALFVPLIRTRHAALGLPAEITAETCRGIGAGVFAALREYPDELVHKLGWAGLYCREIMFKAGIFVYRLAPISEKLPVWAFRERASGKVAAVAADGIAVAANGLIAANGRPAAFAARLRETPTEISGNLVDPRGRISSARITLPLDVWENVLKPGIMTAEIHIPPGRSMLSADCGFSLKWAAQIIQKYLDRHGARCLTCMSWILSPDWPELLPDSNMAKFMREVYLFPIQAPPAMGVNFVFRKRPEDLDLKNAPRQSRLQRIMLERLEKHEPLYGGGMFMLFEDVDKFGTQYYQGKMQ